MTKEELLERLKQSANSDDTEGAHSDADDDLIAYINDEDITKAYNEVPKWYA